MPIPASPPTARGSRAQENGCVCWRFRAAICLPGDRCLTCRYRSWQCLRLPPGLATDLALYNAPVRILISAGEASGEMYGAQLVKALRRSIAHVGTADSKSQLDFFG